MKNNAETISDIIFTSLPSSTSTSRTHRSYSKLVHRVVAARQQLVLTSCDQLKNSLAALGIGTILFISIYLFLSQLAEYGWQ